MAPCCIRVGRRVQDGMGVCAPKATDALGWVTFVCQRRIGAGDVSCAAAALERQKAMGPQSDVP